jgi:hypothetical protein
MSVNFPNPSRSYDEQKQCICFWGYDQAIEISFFVGVDALKRLCPTMANMESAFLQTFDAAVTRIHDVANKVHKRTGKGSYAYVLAAENF